MKLKKKCSEMNDEFVMRNRDRWNQLAAVGVRHSKPFLHYTREDAKAHVCRYGVLSDVKGKRVLCLGGGGGQDSVAFGLLGAEVTVLDLSDVQLERDAQAAEHHSLRTVRVQGDMRDLGAFASDSFDIVWQPYSLNYCPTVKPVFKESSRVLRSGGIYHVAFANPFTMQATDDDCWNGTGYLLRGSYIDGEDISKYCPRWPVAQDDGSSKEVDRPHQFRHNLSTVMNTLVGCGFVLLHIQEYMKQDKEPKAGSWAHFTQAAPPWFDSFWRLGNQ
jgi:ubiquinone/menaquinone biosynthesis C-methylase UbiE